MNVADWGPREWALIAPLKVACSPFVVSAWIHQLRVTSQLCTVETGPEILEYFRRAHSDVLAHDRPLIDGPRVRFSLLQYPYRSNDDYEVIAPRVEHRLNPTWVGAKHELIVCFQLRPDGGAFQHLIWADREQFLK